jgi:histone deacetylase 6
MEGSTKPLLVNSVNGNSTYPMEKSQASRGPVSAVNSNTAKGLKQRLAEAKLGGFLETGLCYDPRMAAHSDPTGNDEHPEDPARIRHIYRALVQAGLVNDPECIGVSDADNPGPLKRIMAREVTKEEALLVHTVGQWEFLESTEGMYYSWIFRSTVSTESLPMIANPFTPMH